MTFDKGTDSTLLRKACDYYAACLWCTSQHLDEYLHYAALIESPHTSTSAYAWMCRCLMSVITLAVILACSIIQTVYVT